MEALPGAEPSPKSHTYAVTIPSGSEEPMPLKRIERGTLPWRVEGIRTAIGDCGGSTVSETGALVTVSADAVIVTAPGWSAVTTPVPSTEAMLESDEVHAKTTPSILTLEASFAVAWSCWVAPIFRWSEFTCAISIDAIFG